MGKDGSDGNQRKKEAEKEEEEGIAESGDEDVH